MTLFGAGCTAWHVSSTVNCHGDRGSSPADDEWLVAGAAVGIASGRAHRHRAAYGAQDTAESTKICAAGEGPPGFRKFL